MSALKESVDSAGYRCYLWPSEAPSEDMTWHLERTSLSVYRMSEVEELRPPLGRLEFAYRVKLLCDSQMQTKEGRLNVGVFSFAGSPVEHIVADISAFLDNLGVEAPT